MWKGTNAIGMGCAAVILVAVSGCGQGEVSPPVAVQPSVFEQQAMMMREAMNMAKQAQEMQMQRIAIMEREMRESGEPDNDRGATSSHMREYEESTRGR